jgi:hypothetical protein
LGECVLVCQFKSDRKSEAEEVLVGKVSAFSGGTVFVYHHITIGHFAHLA